MREEALTGSIMNLITRVIPSESGKALVVEFRNPRNDRWELAIVCFSDEAAMRAKSFYDSRTFKGWTSEKLLVSGYLLGYLFSWTGVALAFIWGFIADDVFTSLGWEKDY